MLLPIQRLKAVEFLIYSKIPGSAKNYALGKLIWLSTCISVIMEINMSRIQTQKIKTLA